ncbi:hypothetical protein AVEN_153920-1 [Araneus ventricosus]|uniref:Uncharacterized protein n=1 Tax=Araneus ventricosus TaxID=182803 RepID=A0A4Y2F6X7_ARAVE|nr:hypothetical protein AVEN_153920-1 [Araneus ventricosus]
MKDSIGKWPKLAVKVNEKEIEEEKQHSVVSANNIECESITFQLTKRISKFSKTVRVLAWMLRFRLRARRLRRNGNLTDEEISDARKTLFRSVQTECFATEEGKKSLINLEVYKDDEGILLMKTRLTNEDEAEILFLHSKYPIVQQLIEQEHVTNNHAGTLTLLAIL